MNTSIPWNAAVYDQVSTVQQEWGRRVLEGLKLRGGETALDGGCGTGRLALLLSEALPGGAVLAVDHSTEMLAVARAGAGGRILLVQADLMELPYRESVDVIFSNAAFHWVPDHDRLFRSLALALKHGGRLVAQCGGHGNLEQTHAIVWKVAQTPRFAAYFHNWREPYVFATPEETERRMRAAGFGDIETSLTAAPTPFPTRRAFRDFVATVILRSFQSAVPAEERDLFVDAFVDACPAWHLDYVRLNLFGRKA